MDNRNDDIIGRQFGMLIVKSETSPSKDTRGHIIRRFNCLCDCGKERIVQYHNLMSGNINSCGCKRFSKNPPADLVGKRFGKLTVLFEAEPHFTKSGQKKRCWACVCDCGTEKTILQSNLISPTGTRSCGCLSVNGGRRAGSSCNLTGNRYGRLVVIAPAEPRESGSHKYRWLCRCDCGKETIVASDNLQVGHTRSCGCLMKNRLKKAKFGMLTIISRAVGGQHLWTCRCACGNEITVDQDDLFWGTVTNCGCQQRGTTKTDLTGHRFSMLTVLRETESVAGCNGKPVRRWLCRCDCGREVVVRQGNLINKVTRSCGCLRAKKQKNRQKGGKK